MNKSKWVSLLLIVILSLALVACGAGGGGGDAQTGDESAQAGDGNAGDSEEPVSPESGTAEDEGQPATLVWTTIVNEGSEGATHIEKMIEYLAEHGSNITLDPQYAGVLGTERETTEQIIMGSIEAGSISDLGATALMPEIAFSDFPGMYRDMDEVKEKFFNGWVGEEIKKIGEKYGVHVLGYTDNAFRWISNSKRPIEKIEDLKGLKIRVPETDFLVKFFERFGALPAAVPFGELPAALQQGTVDGQENGPISIWPYGLYEYNKYLTQTNHSYCSHISMVNQGVWDSLSAKQQKDLQDAFDYAAPLQWDAMAAHIQSCIDNLDKEEGVEIVWLDDEMYQALVEAGKETASSDYYVDMFGQDIVDKMYQ